jgi:hypothetical protein
LGLVLGDGAVFVVIGKGNESPQGNGPQGELHTAALALQQHRPKADRKAADADPLPGSPVP